MRFVSIYIFLLSAQTLFAYFPVETIDNCSSFKWVTNNRYRLVMQCNKRKNPGRHRIAWVPFEINSAIKKGLLPKKKLGSITIRVIEYDKESKKPVKYDQSKKGMNSYFVPAKLDSWARKHGNKAISRVPYLSWVRRNNDGPGAVYICYFDYKEKHFEDKFPKPAFIGSGDALSFGLPGIVGPVRGAPLVFDFDGDGDKDLLGQLSMVPERTVYFYENRGDAIQSTFNEPTSVRSSNPIKRCRQIEDINGDGFIDAVSTGGYYSNIREYGFENWVQIEFFSGSDAGQIINESRSRSWYIFDWDGDQVRDVIIGCGYWKEYGWSNAHDENGNWTNGPLRGWFYFCKNQGTNRNFKLSEPVQIKTVDGNNAEVYGYANPILIDINNDKKPDLISGEFLNHIYIFKNISSSEIPVFHPRRQLETTEGIFEAEYQANSVFACDYENDGDIDIFIRGENDSVGYLENTGLLNKSNMPIFEPVRYLNCFTDYLVSGQLPAIDMYDWNKDGKLDLIYGDSPGHLGWYECLKSYPELQFKQRKVFRANGGKIRITAGFMGSIQGPAEKKWGYTVPCAGDWNRDGFPDIIFNSIWGRVSWFENQALVLNGFDMLKGKKKVKVQWPGPAPKPEWRWWDPEADEWSTQWRSSVQIIDWDRDGLEDVAALDHEGFLVLHRRYKKDDRLYLGPAERIFLDYEGNPWQINPHKPGGCGRRKFVFADWDNDGDNDFIVDKSDMGGNVVLYKNITDDKAPRFVLYDSLADIVVAGHSCSPEVFDLENDGQLDLLLAAEDGHFYCFHRSYIEDKMSLMASFLNYRKTITPDNKIVLFDEFPVVGQFLNAQISSQMAFSGQNALKAQNDESGFYSFSLDLRGNIDIKNKNILYARVNFLTDRKYSNTALKWIQVYTYAGRHKKPGISKYYPYNRDGINSGLYKIDGQIIKGNDKIEFDNDSQTWQLLMLDLGSGPGLPAVNSLKPSSLIRRIDFVFKGVTKVYVDEIYCKSKVISR
jgi:hypothetical protein